MPTTVKLTPAQSRTLVSMLEHGVGTRSARATAAAFGATTATMTVLERAGLVYLVDRFPSGVCLYRLTTAGWSVAWKTRRQARA